MQTNRSLKRLPLVCSIDGPCSSRKSVQQLNFVRAFQCRQQNKSRNRLLCTASLGKGRNAVKAVEVSSLLYLFSQLPADAVDSAVDFSKGSFKTESYVVTLFLFLISLPGMQPHCLPHLIPHTNISRQILDLLLMKAPPCSIDNLSVR